MDRFMEARRPSDEPDQRLASAIHLIQETVEGLLAEGYTHAELLDLIGLDSTHVQRSS